MMTTAIAPERLIRYRGINNRFYTYSNEDHLMVAGVEPYQFDVDGFLTGKSSSPLATTYRYSSRGELQEAKLPDAPTLTYDHDPMGRRIARRVNGEVVEKYLWKDTTTLLAIYNGSDNLVTRFNYGDDRMPVSMTHNGSTYYLLVDPVGSLRAVADSSGKIIKRVDYDSFGNIVFDSKADFSVPFGFAGGLHDRTTGLVRFGARDYDPTIGRWTAKDPIDFAGGEANLYGYVGNDPVNWVDPEGLFGPGGPGTQHPGHGDFPGSDLFNYNLEDTGPTKPVPFIGDPERHFRDLPISNRDVAAAVNSCDKEGFERAAHRGQDFFSHYSKGYRWRPFRWRKSLGIGHIFPLININLPDQDRGAWKKASEWTMQRLNEWNNNCGCKK